MCDPKKAYLSFDVGIKNLAYCLLDQDGIILLWDVLDISGPTYDKQCSKLIKELDNIKYDQLEGPYDITVIIEKQMARNPKMRIISGQLQMYFALEKYYTPDPDKTKIVKILYYSPKYKLRCYKKQEGDPPVVPKKIKSQYAIRKDLAIQHCSIMIKRSNQNQNFIDFFNNNKKKKDDLSDSYLQGMAYILGFK